MDSAIGSDLFRLVSTCRYDVQVKRVLSSSDSIKPELTSNRNLYLAGVLFSPLYFPVTAETFNFSPVIFGAITIFGIITYLVTPEDKWLPAARLGKVHRLDEEYDSANST